MTQIHQPEKHEHTNGDDSSSGTARRLRHRAADLKADVREVGRLGRDLARQQVETTGKAASEALDAGKRKTLQSARHVGDWAQRKPLTAMLASVGVGAVIGWLLRRR